MHLTLAGIDTLATTALCARCPSGPAGCCAAPPAVAWADLGRIVLRGGSAFLQAEMAAGRLRPCARGLAISRAPGPHGFACVYLGERGCTLPPDRRSVTCNTYLCAEAHAEAEERGDPQAAGARRAHEALEAALGAWDEALAAELPAEPAWDEDFFRALGEAVERVVRRAPLHGSLGPRP